MCKTKGFLRKCKTLERHENAAPDRAAFLYLAASEADPHPWPRICGSGSSSEHQIIQGHVGRRWLAEDHKTLAQQDL